MRTKPESAEIVGGRRKRDTSAFYAARSEESVPFILSSFLGDAAAAAAAVSWMGGAQEAKRDLVFSSSRKNEFCIAR